MRLSPPRDPVAMTLDGERFLGERGEPVAAALIGAGKLMVARSPKFHRPRGPSCMRGACDGCLARVDGVANVMTCLTEAAEGRVITSQNRLGSREHDLLRMTDWFFPDGFNHHDLLAGIPGVQGAMQAFARRVAGLGRLPDEVVKARPATRRRIDVLVVGAGPAGMAAATAVARSARLARRTVEVVDDALAAGGGARGFMGHDGSGFDAVEKAFHAVVGEGRVVLRCQTVAAGFYGRDVLVVGPEGAEVVEAADVVIAAGAHDGVAPFENNEVPGVLSARAACLLLASGVLFGKRAVLAREESLSPGGAPDGAPGSKVIRFGDVYQRAAAAASMGGATVRVVDSSAVVGVKGSSHVRAVVVREGDKELSLPADVLLVDVPPAPAYELCEQAGARLEHRPCGFVPIVSRGRIAEGVWAVGEVSGAPLDIDAFVAQAEALAAALE